MTRCRSFDSVAAALDHAQVVPCSSQSCEGAHVVGWAESGVIACEFAGRHRPVDLATELGELYRRQAGSIPPMCWPTPSILNRPLSQAERIRR
jgi:hypothetical protein